MPLVLAFLIVLLACMARAEEHQHPPQDAQIHEQFYSTWFMPDNPLKSCCNKIDCYPTVFEKTGGQWYARRREDGKMIRVPPEKLEHNTATPRDSPDGRSHACMPGLNHPDAGTVFCAALGSWQ